MKLKAGKGTFESILQVLRATCMLDDRLASVAAAHAAADPAASADGGPV